MKMSEPLFQYQRQPNGDVYFDEDPPTEYEKSLGWQPLYDKQALLDLLEAAAVECESRHANGNHKHDTRAECASAIRELKEKIK